MNPFQTIVVGVDFSDASISAIHEATRLAEAGGGRVIAVEVVEKEVLEEQTRFHKVAAEQAVERIHANLLNHLASHGADKGVEARVVVGNPYAALNEVCRATAADLLVLGSRGWDHSQGTVGTVASKCVRRMPLPVLLVRRQHAGAFKHIVACTDFSHTAKLAVGRAIHLAAKENALLDIVHVDYPVWLQPVHVQYELRRAPDADYEQQYRATVRDRLAHHVADLYPPAGLAMNLHVLEDVRAADAIASFLKEKQADLVVLGTSGRTGLNAILLGTTAERLIYRSECSALAVKPPSADGH